MYYATTTTIDGYEIITGIDKKQIDRIETEKRILPMLDGLQESKAIKARGEKVKGYYNNINGYKKSQQKIIETASVFKQVPITMISEKDLTLQQKEKINELNEKIKFNQSQVDEIKKDLPEVIKKFNDKKIQLITENAVYFGMPGNAIDLSGKQAQEIMTALSENAIELEKTGIKKLLTVSGEKIIDNRGKIVWLYVSGEGWSSREILFLGDNIDISEIVESDLTDEQKQEIAFQNECQRIESLTEEEKKSEFESLKKSLLNQSIAMKNELEIQADTKALTKSQTWYTDQLLELSDKYSI
jgi:hypothetical protein